MVGASKLYFRSSQIANPQILELIPLLQIRKFLRYASPQIANPQIANPQIANLQNTTNFCATLSQNSPKSRLFTRFFICRVHNFNFSFRCYAILVRSTGMYLPTCGNFKSANRKSATGHICRRSANLKSENLRIAIFVTYLRIAQL